MKKVKYIALALVLCLGLIGGAYAWWTDTLEIDGTVATGEVKVNYTGYRNITPQGLLGGYVTGNISNPDDKTLVFTIQDLFPHNGGWGNIVEIRFRIENEGTVPIKLKDVMVTKTNNEESPLWEHLRASGQLYYRPGGVGSPGQSLGSTGACNIMELGGKLVELASNNNLVLYPGDQLHFDDSIYIWLHRDAPNETQDEAVELNMVMTWVQWNAQ